MIIFNMVITFVVRANLSFPSSLDRRSLGQRSCRGLIQVDHIPIIMIMWWLFATHTVTITITTRVAQGPILLQARLSHQTTWDSPLSMGGNPLEHNDGDHGDDDPQVRDGELDQFASSRCGKSSSTNCSTSSKHCFKVLKRVPHCFASILIAIDKGRGKGLGAQSLTSLKADLWQGINWGFGINFSLKKFSINDLGSSRYFDHKFCHPRHTGMQCNAYIMFLQSIGNAHFKNLMLLCF